MKIRVSSTQCLRAKNLRKQSREMKIPEMQIPDVINKNHLISSTIPLG